MNARVNLAGEIALPEEVLNELDLRPGSEVVFERGPEGEILLMKAAGAQRPSIEEIRRRIASVRGMARPGLTTGEFMQIMRGDE